MPLIKSSDETTFKCFRASLLKASAVGLACAATAVPAHAQSECGVTTGGAVTCAATGNPYANGIAYAPAAGDLTLTTNTDVAVTGPVRVTTIGTTTVVNNGTVTTTGNDRPGIVATGVNAAVTSIEDVSTSGTRGTTSNGDGIAIIGTTGTATAIVKNISVTGPLSTGAGAVRPRALVVTAGTAAAATINGTVSSINGDAAVIAGTAATATVAGGASVSGGVNGIVLTGSASVSLTNAGTITGGTGAAVSVTSGTSVVPTAGTTTIANSGTIGSGVSLAILATRGPTTVTNTGTINGSVRLSFLNDTVNKGGTFNALSNSDFGDGSDVFNNSGTLNVLSGSAVPSTIEFTSLETFNNSGTINLVNGRTGNSLTLPGTFNGTGGSTLALDVVTGATPASDRLIVQGAATGSTAIVLNGLTSANATVTSGIILATGGAGTSTTAFGIAAQSQNVGFITYTIVPTAAAGTTSFVVVGTLGDGVVRMTKISEGAQNLWYRSADTLAAHMTDLRATQRGVDDQKPVSNVRIWGAMSGGVQRRSDTQLATAYGVSRVVDTSYRQDAFGGQVGLEAVRIVGSGSLTFGITGGYLTSKLKFSTTAERTSYDALNAGAYVSFISGPIFANALAKYDHYSIYSVSPLANFASRYHGKSYGGQGEVGLHLSFGTFFAEPAVSAAIVRTDLDSPIVPNATLNFASMDGARGKAGLLLGASLDGEPNHVVLYVSGNAVHEFRGGSVLTFTSNATPFSYGSNRIGTYGEGKVGLNIASAGGVTGFIEGFGNYSRNYRGGGAQAGLRVGF